MTHSVHSSLDWMLLTWALHHASVLGGSRFYFRSSTPGEHESGRQAYQVLTQLTRAHLSLLVSPSAPYPATAWQRAALKQTRATRARGLHPMMTPALKAARIPCHSLCEGTPPEQRSVLLPAPLWGRNSEYLSSDIWKLVMNRCYEQVLYNTCYEQVLYNIL